MKCEKCNIEMKEGFFNAGMWFQGERKKTFDPVNKLLSKNNDYVKAFKCSKCGKIDLYSTKIE